MAASPSPAEHPLVAAWRAGVARLDRDHCRVPGMLGARRYPDFESEWAGVCRMMAAFLDVWGERAAALGWTTEALFGVHRRAGALRMDATGALITLRPMRVVSVKSGLIVLERRGAHQTARGLTNPAESIPVWDFQ